ncbi:MAG: hypothetical protein ACM3ST_15080 [Bdellovibrio bacteriovorus]
MKLRRITLAVAAALGGGILSAALYGFGLRPAGPAVASMELIGMEPPASVDEKSDIYTRAKLKVTYRNGESRTYKLRYHQLMATTDVIDDQVVGGLFDVNNAPLLDKDGPMASDAADGTSLIRVPGMRVQDPSSSHPLALVTQFEYKELPPKDGVSTGSFWSKLPALMSLAKLEQNKGTGALEAVDYDPISFSHINGGWIHCGSTLSAWDTHVGSEEYEPDAKTRE